MHNGLIINSGFKEYPAKMIEILNGLRETIKYSELSRLRMYHNTHAENYPNHWHVAFEIIMPIENWYDICVGNDTYHLEENDILFIHPGVIHKLQSPSNGKRVILQFDLSLLYDLKEFDTTLFMLPSVIKLSGQEHSDIYPVILFHLQQIIEEYDSNHALKEAAIYSSLIRIYVLLCRNVIFNQKKFEHIHRNKRQEYIEKLLFICDYLNKNCSEPINLDLAAAKAGFSKFHFTRLFKEFTGMTFQNYLNQQRVTKAERLLLDRNLSIMDVAMNSGFNSISTFTRVFKQVKGCSANTFRKQRINHGLD